MQTLQFLAGLLIIITIVSETVITAIKQKEVYDRRDALTNFLIGFFAILVGLMMKGFSLGVFMSIQPFVPFHFQFTMVSAVLLFLLSDMQYYWFHRLGHVSRFFWASHVIHHSSHHYNYSVGMRLPFTNGLYRFLFWMPIVLLGFPPEMVLLMDALVNFYTFFLHTEAIGKLGWLEKFLNTPSHHRVHHSSNPQYLDTNYGGVLIIWDKLFGTYADEEEKTRYGLTKPFNTYNPVKIVFDEWQGMIKDLRTAKGVNEILKVVFGSPGWKPATMERTNFTKAENSRPLPGKIYLPISSLPSKFNMMQTVRPLILLCCLAMLCSSFSGSDSQNWILKKNENGITVYTRTVAGSDLKEVRVVNRVKSSLSGMVAILLDSKNYSDWMVGCKEARILKVMSDHEFYNYQITDLPWPLSDRDVVADFKIEQDANTKIVSFTKTAMPLLIPENSGLVRVQYLHARYVLKPLSSDSVLVEMEMQLNPGGSIPAWLINANIVAAPYKSTEQMIKRLPVYQSASYSFIEELPESL